MRMNLGSGACPPNPAPANDDAPTCPVPTDLANASAASPFLRPSFRSEYFGRFRSSGGGTGYETPTSARTVRCGTSFFGLPKGVGHIGKLRFGSGSDGGWKRSACVTEGTGSTDSASCPSLSNAPPSSRGSAKTRAISVSVAFSSPNGLPRTSPPSSDRASAKFFSLGPDPFSEGDVFRPNSKRIFSCLSRSCDVAPGTCDAFVSRSNSSRVSSPSLSSSCSSAPNTPASRKADSSSEERPPA
mmetsp:Transcript_10517/g.38978  ORF Transcript_10517/g.38978 Transcript_10517/m.38978 type:complete len:243 (-) Transcript_10517:289-1017(-)